MGVARRISWGLADQAVSSLTNFAVGVYAARTLGVSEFGVFTLAWVTYAVVLNISRGLATDPLTVRFSGVATELWRTAAARASGTALRVGAAAGAVSVTAGLLVGGPIGSGFVGLGLILPALLLQDSWRYAFFSAGQGHKAFANDVVWAIALVPGLFLAAQEGTVLAFLIGWGGAGAVAAAYGWFQLGVRPRWGGTASWLRQHRDLGPRYMVENVSGSGAAQVRMYGLGAIAGLADVGAVRGAELLLGPFLALLMGLSMVVVPEAARIVRQDPHRLRRFCLLLGGGQAAAALAWGAALLLLLPEALGRFALGPVWEPASLLIVPATLSVVAAGWCTGAATGLRALGAAPRSLRAQLFQSAGYAGGGLAGAAVAGAAGSSWGVAIAMWLAVAVWWFQLRAGLAALPAGDAGDAAAGAVHAEEMRT